MKLTFLGGADEVGRSGVLVNDRLLLDFGLKTGPPLQQPLSPGTVDAVAVSHGHLDHGGAVPSLCASGRCPPIHLTPPTGELIRLLGQDTLKLHGQTPTAPFTRADLDRLPQAYHYHEYGKPVSVAGHELTFYNAGHIPGSAHILVDDGQTRLLYTGDFTTAAQRLLSPSTARPAADVVICESTYATVTRPPRTEIESAFVEFVEETLWEGGTVLIPAFAIGRTQEVLSVLAAADIDCYVDGMGVEVADRLRQHEAFLDTAQLRRALGHARIVDGADGQRRRIAEKSTAIVTTAGMLQGGPALSYLPEISGHPTNAVALTGYQVPGTPGRELVETGRLPINGRHLAVSATVKQFNLSAHADRSGLRSFLDSYTDATVYLVHGEETQSFAADLRDEEVNAVAPTPGEEYYH